MEHPLQIVHIHSAFTVEEPVGFNYPGESHDYWEMVWIEKGTVGITAGSRVFTCLPGTVVLHRPNEFHRIWNAGDSSIQFTIISFSAVGEYQQALYRKVVANTAETEYLLQMLKGMILKHRANDRFLPRKFYDDPVIGARFSTGLKLFLYTCADVAEQPQQTATGSAAVFSAAVKTMRENISQPMKTQELALALHISLSQLKKVFQQYASTGVHEYFLGMKLDLARQMLAGGESVNATAEAVGFDCGNYFSAVFKRETGMTPTAYRNANRNEK